VSEHPSRTLRAKRTLRWLVHTPWPILALDLLRANLIGAVFTFAFLRFGLPYDTAVKLGEISGRNQVLFICYLLIALIIGAYFTIRLTLPVLLWHRRRGAVDSEFARRRALRLPSLVTYVCVGLWFVGGVIFTLFNFASSHRAALLVAVATAVGCLITSTLCYMQTEKVLRPITVAAMAGNPEDATAPTVTMRIVLFWVACTALPLLVITGLVVAQQMGGMQQDVSTLQRPILWMALVALAFGLLAVSRLVSAIADPIKQLRQAQRAVQDGDLDTAVKIFDGSDLGQLQAGFNNMVHDLRERNELRNLFGRYVGEDVARRAMESGTELGGSERYVGVLFVDVVGSTNLGVTRPPGEVVELLNEFFRVVVDVVGRHEGFVNKFQGDAALAIFGAPLDDADFAGHALAAARELRVELDKALEGLDVGIGVSAGKAIAGHIGAQQRLEYTVIGDPVNEAARLTELAKDEPSRVLGSARAVYLTNSDEAQHWQVGEGVELRGRGIETRLARPILDLPTTDDALATA
jgi:adenylate cyclase